MKKIITLFVFLLITLISFSQTKDIFYWSGNSGSSDNIDQDDNWSTSGHPSEGDNLYFSNTTGSRHWPYSNYGTGSWFGWINTYSGAGGIKWRGNKTWAYKFENNSDPTLFEIESDIGNRGGSNLELNPVGSGGVKVTGNIDMEASRTLDVYGTNQLEITGVISGSNVNLTIHNAATVILTATNTYTGTTTVSAGILELQGSIANSNVTIQNGATLKINGDVTIGSLTIQAGGTLEVLSNKSLIVSGSTSEYRGTTIIRENGAMTINGSDFEVHETFTIEPNAELTVDGPQITWSGTFTIQSTEDGTGSYIDNAVVLGSVIVERYIAGADWTDDTDGWHLLSSPVKNQNISDEFVDVDDIPISPDLDFYRWSESATTEGWINIKQSNGNYNQGSAASNFSNDDNPEFGSGVGYLIAYNNEQTKSFTGGITVNDVSSGSLSYTSASDNTGWHLLGNPYPSALEWDQTNWGRSNINGTAKIWRTTPSASYKDITKGDIIPTMQGFMVEVNNASGGSLTIDAADRTHSTTNWYKTTEVNKIKFIAYDTEGSTAQESIIRINENATIGFDTEYDSHFLKGYAPQFFSVIENGEIVSTNALPEITSTTTIPMSFIKNNSSTFYIEAEGVNNLEPQETVYLTDLKTNHTQILNDNPSYDFTSEEGDVAERFLIHFSALSIDDILLSEQINVFAADNKVEIRSNKPIDAQIFVYNIAGQRIATSQLNNESSASVGMPNYKGAAIVSIVTSGQSLTEKVIIW